ncbi:hypothetical protein F9K33_06490 [bacterium]|nr:MAG: hypothetical protein F9K33_06490 [bacterium]
MKTLFTLLFTMAAFNVRTIAADLDTTSSLSVVKIKNRFQIPVLQDQTKTNIPVKSPSKAMKMALGHTLIPIGAGLGLMIIGDSNVEGIRRVSGLTLLTYGGLVGPSMGNFYAKDYTKGGLGIGMRAIGTLMVASSIGKAMAWGNDDEAEGPAPGEMMGTVGVLLVLGSTVWNIMSAPGSANTYNEKHGLSGVSVGYDPVSKAGLVSFRITF